MTMKNKIRRYLITLVVLAIAGSVLLVYWFAAERNPYEASIFVEPGDAFYRVVIKLKDREVIDSPWLFSKIGIIIGLDRRIIPGRYDFPAGSSNFSVMQRLWRGDIAIVGMTIPEGYNLKQIGQTLSVTCGTSLEEFDSLVRDSLFLDSLGINTGFAEGYLYPETYNFEWGIPARQAIATMVRQLKSRLTEAVLNRATELGYNLNELLTMASIIEAEGQAPDEYKTIASVYRNRLKIDMKLQADPTVIYGMGGLNRNLLIKDYQFPSKYNTYLHEGLPPTPICSPGWDAIEAALYPDSTEYLYFVADGSGRHIFNKSYREHLQATRTAKNNQKRRSQ